MINVDSMRQADGEVYLGRDGNDEVIVDDLLGLPQVTLCALKDAPADDMKSVRLDIARKITRAWLP